MAPRPTEIVFVRHAETVANATGRYNTKTLNSFSQLGEKQVSKLTQRLKQMHFDAIVVSPSDRALKTLAPYLSQTRQTATIWPELYEVCHQVGAARQKPALPQVRFGSKIDPPSWLAPYYRLRNGGDRYIDAPTYNDGMRQIALAYKLAMKDYSNSGKTILMVGHGLQGSRMLEMLEGKKPVGKVRVANTEIVRLRELPNGRFVPVKS